MERLACLYILEEDEIAPLTFGLLLRDMGGALFVEDRGGAAAAGFV